MVIDDNNATWKKQETSKEICLVRTLNKFGKKYSCRDSRMDCPTLCSLKSKYVRMVDCMSCVSTTGSESLRLVEKWPTKWGFSTRSALNPIVNNLATILKKILLFEIRLWIKCSSMGPHTNFKNLKDSDFLKICSRFWSFNYNNHFKFVSNFLSIAA